ncbi:hypothetical protein Tco_0215356 [Tanacetum coccineum]
MEFGGNARDLGSFEKERTRLQLYTKVEEEKGTRTLETASQLLVTASEHQRDGVRKFETASGLNRHSEALEDLAKRRRQDYKTTSSQSCKIEGNGWEIFKVDLGEYGWCNFVARVKGLKVFVGNFTYECNFVMLEDTTSVIDHYLGRIVLGKPFVKETGLVYNKEDGTDMFEKGNEKIIFKMPHKMERFKHIDFEEIKIDCIPPFVIEGNDDNHEKTYYSDSLNLGPAYRRDKSESTLKRSPNPFELFVYTHTENHDEITFIDKKAKTINDNVLRLRQARKENASIDGESS